jgi:streptomycin 6-kinase
MSKLCARHGLTVVSNRAGAADGSRYVAHVRDKRGRNLLLKQTTPERRTGEIAALRAWKGSDACVQLVAELEDGAYLAEWLEGTSLAELPPDESIDFEAVGRMLRALHATRPCLGVTDVASLFTPEFSRGWHELTSEMLQFFVQTADRLAAKQHNITTLLHGDVVPANVIITAERHRVIDPIGRSGTPAWDVAQFCVAALGRGHRHVVAPVLEGYGTMPPHFSDMFAWMMLFFLRNNLAAGRAQFVSNLLPIASALVSFGDADEFVQSTSGI